MPKTLTPRINLSFVRLAFFLFLMAILVGSLLETRRAQAMSRFSCALITTGGTTRTLSCGGSAGNFVFACSSSGCVDETGSNETNQAIADQLCAQYDSQGCPEMTYGTPYIAPEESAR